jgi:hypothetical protein
MKTKTASLFIIFLFSMSPLLNAQAVERFIRSKVNVATNRASDRANEEIDNKIEQEVDRGIDSLLNKNESQEQETRSNSNEDTQKGSSSSSSRRSGAFMKSLGLDAPANISESYNYKGYMLMDIESWDSKGKKEELSNYITYFNETEKNFAMEFSNPEKEKSVIIFDAENKAMIILSDDGNEKSGIVTPLNYDTSTSAEDGSQNTDMNNAEMTDADSPFLNTNYKKTGRTKTVSGYSCEEYFYEDDESTMSLWITNDLPADLYARIFSVSTFASYSNTGAPQGFTMEWEMKKKNSKEQSIMTVKEVDKNKQTTIKTTGYTIINLGGMMNQE